MDHRLELDHGYDLSNCVLIVSKQSAGLMLYFLKFPLFVLGFYIIYIESASIPTTIHICDSNLD